MNREEQLSWEARWGRPAGVAAILAGIMFLVGGFVGPRGNRKGIEPYPDGLLSIHEHPGPFFVSTILPVLATLFAAAAFYYLFRATQARGGSMPRWFVYIIVGAPIVYAISQVLFAIEVRDLADRFVAQDIIRGKAGDNKAKDLADFSPVFEGLRSAGFVAIAFLYVMLPLRARRVGLVTPFMSILGVIVGALTVIGVFAPAPVVQAFWLGALGMLLLGRWRGGRGPAWESGEAEPWPTAAQRRGLVPMPGEEPQLDPNEPVEPEPEPVPERPASRKRRRKR